VRIRTTFHRKSVIILSISKNAVAFSAQNATLGYSMVFLAIHAGSVPSWLFSKIGLILNSKRCSLFPDKVNMVTFIHDYYMITCREWNRHTHTHTHTVITHYHPVHVFFRMQFNPPIGLLYLLYDLSCHIYAIQSVRRHAVCHISHFRLSIVNAQAAGPVSQQAATGWAR